VHFCVLCVPQPRGVLCVLVTRLNI
jgi:hypothetical protein